MVIPIIRKDITDLIQMPTHMTTTGTILLIHTTDDMSITEIIPVAEAVLSGGRRERNGIKDGNMKAGPITRVMANMQMPRKAQGARSMRAGQVDTGAEAVRAVDNTVNQV